MVNKSKKTISLISGINSVEQLEQFRQCPKFQTCSAAICPLDSEWQLRSNQNFDRICFYLAESVKINAKAIFDKQGIGHLFKVMSVVRQEIITAHPRVKDVLKRSSVTSSRLNHKFTNLKTNFGLN